MKIDHNDPGAAAVLIRAAVDQTAPILDILNSIGESVFTIDKDGDIEIHHRIGETANGYFPSGW